jgi:hypothetical protein
MRHARDIEDQCLIAINLMAADYQAAAGDSSARRSSAIPINMIFWKVRQPDYDSERKDLLAISLRFYRGAKCHELRHAVGISECLFIGAGSTGRRNTGVKSLCWGFQVARSHVAVEQRSFARS